MKRENVTDGTADGTAEGAGDASAATRRARFGRLPERIRYDEMVTGQSVAPGDPARHAWDPERSWTSFSCLAADLGL
ncbi:hypothetical protein [Streptomyces rishiriensis]|uniref:hypothetical protein n=1 Tax=Streptomyces rishiriensis TaxID=68264 RepID=UPI000D595473|nr:hypothetical protein [Streptomyces rishiriensis]